MIVGLIFIYKKHLFNVKIEIYYQIIRLIIKNKYNNSHLFDQFLDFSFKNWINIIALERMVVKNWLKIFVDKNIW